MTKKIKRNSVKILALLMGFGTAGGFIFENLGHQLGENKANAVSAVSRVDGAVQTDVTEYFDSKVAYKLPETISSSQEISVIVSMNADCVLDSYAESDQTLTAKQYVTTGEARAVARKTERERNALIKKLDKSGIEYTLGDKYDTVLSGFEITIKAKDFEKAGKLLNNQAKLIVGEVYAPTEDQVITNEVDVYETGIFDSSKSAYQGDGVVVAVLDTGLDFSHTAFSVDNFTTTEEAFTLDTVAEKIGSTSAAKSSAGLTAEDVYVSRKVPYAYDYADKDENVSPINSAHGTHVAGVIAGKDETITGVAPNAQLAIMKVFSDKTDGARTSWLLAALEDCVTLGVDVINMSLGSGCGFTREEDEKEVAEIYDNIRAAGISLIASAANSYNATMSSEKNGNNGLTSNPDSGTVGSPSTYDAALSVASVDGVKTSYLLFGSEVIYFTEASTSDAQLKKSFVNDILKTKGEDVTEAEFEYVPIPGIGRSSDYMEPNEYYKGKIVLVRRGTSTFEEKVRIALKEKGAAGIIIYNNVSGNISMSVGANIGAVCSLSQDQGEKLAAAAPEKRFLKIAKGQAAGPFMSDFSSWGPTSDLKIKPEITAHGGEILSSVPGQKYERMSGTSMAAPNQAGATALIRQYVKFSGVFGNDVPATEVTKRVNQLMMSTADIVMNKNGLPYAVRKQGAGLVNISKATSTAAYISVFDKNGAETDKSKLELGDDKAKTGVYEATFAVNNIRASAVSYNVDSVILTEGVSKTYTGHGERTVTQEGYLLSGTQTEVVSLSGDGAKDGNRITIQPKKSVRVTVKITLSEADKQYMNESFEHGMYVEGFVKFAPQSGTEVSMNVPLLAFYGDWTEAPIFDEEYYDTNKDELNKGLDPEDKMMPDAYATRVIGGLYSDYISTMGAYPFVQDPDATPIAANKEHIAVSNQEGKSGAINKIRSITAGLLRNAKRMDISITEEATGREIYTDTKYNVIKSFNRGGAIYGSSVDIDFSTLEYNLKNNTRYNVKMTAYIDYGEDAEQKNVRNVFEFPLYVDFEAPLVTDVVFRKEVDSITKKTKLFADINIYDNHYTMAASLGQIVPYDKPDRKYLYTMKGFTKYITPVYSEFNSTSLVSFDLTDYISQIKKSLGNNNQLNNSFVISCYDYAFNSATYEIRLPDEVVSMYFSEDTITLNPNETKLLSDCLNVFPGESWIEMLKFESTDPDVAGVVNQTIIAKKSGDAVITAKGSANGREVSTTVKVHVLAEGEEGYDDSYSLQTVNNFAITGYAIKKAYFGLTSSEKEIGETGGDYSFGGVLSLSMYPSECVQLQYTLDTYDDLLHTGSTLAKVEFSSSNANVTVTSDGTITAQKEGSATITAAVTYNGEPTLYMLTVSVTVKDPYKFTSIYLTSYKGLGGEVIIPDDRGITTIQAYAFSNYDLVDKDLSAGDVIDKESPYYMKQVPVGEDTITKVVIPEGVTTIEQYAFAKLSALEEVVLPSTLNLIGVGAFEDCTKLKKINLENVQFINKDAFKNCNLQDTLDYNENDKPKASKLVAIGDYAFENCKLGTVALPATAQSIGVGAFKNNVELRNLEFKAAKVKIGKEAFAYCTDLTEAEINATVIAAYAFNGCSKLGNVLLGKDVSLIGEYAFANTGVKKFEVSSANPYLETKGDGKYIYKGTELLVAASKGLGSNITLSEATAIATGAFSGNKALYKLIAPNVTSVGDYAFADCTELDEVTIGKVKEIGNYAFANTALKTTLDLSETEKIGKYAFAYTKITSLTLPENVVVDDYAFANNTRLTDVTVGDGAILGNSVFMCSIRYSALEVMTDRLSASEINSYLSTYYNHYQYEVKNEVGAVVKKLNYYSYNLSQGAISALTSLTIGKNVKIGNYAFEGNAALTSVVWSDGKGEGVEIGDYAFFNNAKLASIDLSNVKKIGSGAFYGSRSMDLRVEEVAGKTTVYAAVDVVVKDGKEVQLDALYSTGAALLTNVDLSAAESLGENAFAYNTQITNVTFGPNLKRIPVGAFYKANKLESVTLPEAVEQIGDYAFYSSGLATVNLDHIETIGTSAFAKTKLASVTLKDGAAIGDYAFNRCERLSTVSNLEKAVEIGDCAFESTAIEELNLAETKSVGSFAFANSAVKKVSFGDKLIALGENPFRGCDIKTFARMEKVMFGGEYIEDTLNGTYDVSETVKVKDGVLYQVHSTGLELVSYPKLKTDEGYKVEEGTVRISGSAFEGNEYLKNVTVAYTTKAIGSKAFYECNKLNLVVFLGYNAPLLEEEYDTSYVKEENKPYNNGTGNVSISKYYMWNVSTSLEDGHGELFYYGANFVGHVGQMKNKLVMVRPANGKNYDTFIFREYFSAIVDGNNAATQETLNVIAMIANLGSSITLESEAAVKAAREAYNLLSKEQQALVSNYNGYNYDETLSNAENTIAYLKGTSSSDPSGEPENPADNASGKFMGGAYGIVIVAVVVLAVCVAIVLMVKKKQGGVGANSNVQEAEQTVEGTAEQIDENAQPVDSVKETQETQEAEQTEEEKKD